TAVPLTRGQPRTGPGRIQKRLDRTGEVPIIVQVLLFDEGQDLVRPTAPSSNSGLGWNLLPPGYRPKSGTPTAIKNRSVVRQTAHGILVVVHGQAKLFEVVLGLGAGGGLADFLHGRQQQADQDGDDGNHHQQLDQGETTPFSVRTNTG